MFSSSQYSVRAGNAPDAYGAPIVFDFASRIFEVTIKDEPAIVKLSYDGVTFGDEIEYDPNAQGFPYQVFYQCKAFVIKNKTAGNIAAYQMIAWK